MVLYLGYNRPSSMQNDSGSVKGSKMLLFWMANWLDCSFSVSLGHYPLIRSYDIAIQPMGRGMGIPDSFVVAFNYSSRISRLQCKVVAQLFSPAALQMSAAERQKTIPSLIGEIEDAWKSREEVSLLSSIFGMTLISDQERPPERRQSQ